MCENKLKEKNSREHTFSHKWYTVTEILVMLGVR